MDTAYSKLRRERGHTEIWLENLKGRPHLGDVRTAWRIILKWGYSEQGTVLGSCQQSNEVSCSTKGGDLLGQPSDYQLMKYIIPWS